MQRKTIHGFLAALLVVMQLCALVSIRHVHAVESPSVQQTLIDSDDLTLNATGVQNGESIDWTLQYARKDSTQPRALKLDVKAGDADLAPIDATTWHQLQATQGNWWQEKDFSTKASGTLRYQTPISQLSLTITAQLDEQAPATIEAETNAVTPQSIAEPTLNVDLLDDQTSGPHTVTLTLPEVEQPVPDPEDEAAQAEATPESVVTPELPAEAETTPEVAPAVTAEATPETKAAGSPIIEPDRSQSIDATNLVLERYAFADLAVKATNTSGVFFKGPTDVNLGENYDTKAKMETITSKHYVANSSSTAVFFNNERDAAAATIDLSYDNVGLAQLTDGTSIRIGARVSIDGMTYRNADWRNGNQPNPIMAMDFSNNFYSGMMLANVRKFDWHVTFFDIDTKAVVNFVAPSDARLTFTSLNPGEFVKSQENLAFSTADTNSVKLTGLGSDQIAPNNAGRFATWIANGWPKSDPVEVEAYTSHKWGDWSTNPTIDQSTTWHDKLGSPTFGNGAASFALIGTDFNFSRGTYAEAPTTWLANASGDAQFIIPKYVTNNKSISTEAGKGGGTAQDVTKTPSGDPFTPNELHTKNINEQALANTPMYYYINQQTYSLAADLVSLPEKIVIEDTLPEGMAFYGNGTEDIVIFNERDEGSVTRDPTLQGADIQIDGRKLTVTLPHKVLENIPFLGGFFSIQVRVKTTHDPNTIKESFTMDNFAHVAFYENDTKVAWEKRTNEVTVHVTPNLVSPEFTKVDGDGKRLEGVEFSLFDNAQATGTPKHTATSNAQGVVAFKNVYPGQYWLKETQTPTGYQPLKTPIAITVESDGKIKWPSDWQHGNTVVNELKPWTIELEKTDADKQPLAGAEFSLKQADGTVIATGVTTKDAKLKFTGDKLVPGDYVLEETKAPSGFVKLNGKFTFTLNLDGTVADFNYSGDDLKADQYEFNGKNHLLSLTLENNAEDIPLPVTGGSGIQALLATAIVMMLLALMLGWHWRKEAHR